MGAALTYVRRYALTALVGIASEDDLDVPDVTAGPSAPAKPPVQTGGRGKSSKDTLNRPPVLSPEHSPEFPHRFSASPVIKNAPWGCLPGLKNARFS